MCMSSEDQRIWRHWWIDSVREIETMMYVTLESPSPIFTDITDKIDDMKSQLDKNTLGDIMQCCNKYLIPSVLCPWGEAEYIHQCGNIPFDTVLQ